jgi:hypothetical protein
MRTGLSPLVASVYKKSTKSLKCRLGSHCNHPRILKQIITNSFGEEEVEEIIVHDGNIPAISDETSVSYIKDHDGVAWLIHTSKWKLTCCRCGNVKLYIGENKSVSIKGNNNSGLV